MFDDKNLSISSKKTVNPFVMLARNGPVVIKNRMTKPQFHNFLLQNEGLKIERDKYGIITIHPLMTLNSAFNEGEAFFALKLWSKTNRMGKAYSPSAAFDLPDGSTYKADGAWISIRKLNRLSEAEKESIPLLVPDFVMETRSKSDSLQHLKRKMADVWMANGVRLAWLIDPKKQKAWIYRANGSVEEILNFETTLSGEDVLPGFELDLRELR